MRKSILAAISLFAIVIIGILVIQPILSRLTQSAINQNWPPVSYQEKQVESIKISSENLSKITAPSFLVNLSEDKLQEELQGKLQRLQAENKLPFNLKDKLEISFDNQSIFLDAPIEVFLKEKNINLEGHLKGLASFSVIGTNVILSPAFESIEIDKISIPNFFLYTF